MISIFRSYVAVEVDRWILPLVVHLVALPAQRILGCSPDQQRNAARRKVL